MEERSVIVFVHVRLYAGLTVTYYTGAPVQIAQHKDDPILGEDSQRNNDFKFDQVVHSFLDR